MHVLQQLVNIYMKTKMQNVTSALLNSVCLDLTERPFFYYPHQIPCLEAGTPRRGFVAGPGPNFLGEKGLRPWHVNSSALGCGVAIQCCG